MGFGGMVLTMQGRKELAKAELGEPLVFECMAVGDGSGEESVVSLEALRSERQRVPVKSVQRNEDRILVEADFSNEMIQRGFYFREIGLYANGILYAYDHAGEEAEYIDPSGSAVAKQKRIRIALTVSSEAAVIAKMDTGLYALQADFEKSNTILSDMKKKLDGIDENANKYIHPTGAGSRHIPSGGSAGQVLRWKQNGEAVWGSGSYYGVCSTSGSVASKTVKAEGFSLVEGAEISVRFTETNTAQNPMLNVNGTGAKPVYFHGTAIFPGYPEAGSTYDFRYNGAQWELVGDLVTYKDKPWFWNCGNRKVDTEKSVDAEGFRLFQGVRIVIHFQWGNTAADFTMNVNGTGNIPVRYRGEPVPADYIRAGHFVGLVYYDNCWNVVGDLTQAQVYSLKSEITELQSCIRILKDFCLQKEVYEIGFSTEYGKLWAHAGADNVFQEGCTEPGAKCAAVNVMPGVKYAVITSFPLKFNGNNGYEDIPAIMEVSGGNGVNYSFDGNKVEGTGKKDMFEFETGQSTMYLMINCCDPDVEIRVYRTGSWRD